MPYRDPARRREATRLGSRAHYERHREAIIARTAARKARQKQLRKDWEMSTPQRCPKCQGSMTRQEMGGRQFWQCERESCGGRILLDRPHVPHGFTPQTLPVEPEKPSRRRPPVVQEDATEIDDNPLTELENSLLGDEIPIDPDDDAVQDPDAPDPPARQTAPERDDPADRDEPEPDLPSTRPTASQRPPRGGRPRAPYSPSSLSGAFDPRAQALSALDEAIGALDQETVALQARLATIETERQALQQASAVLRRRP